MSAPTGNQFWRVRSSHGRKPIFSNSDDLWSACAEYFDWSENNPLIESVVYQGKVMEAGKPIMRAMTIKGLCLFLDISEDTWSNYRKNEDFLGVTERAENIIYNQKFAGAAAGLFNANIIARDLGLSDKKEQESSGITVVELQTSWGTEEDIKDLTTEELERMVKELESLRAKE